MTRSVINRSSNPSQSTKEKDRPNVCGGYPIRNSSRWYSSEIRLGGQQQENIRRQGMNGDQPVSHTAVDKSSSKLLNRHPVTCVPPLSHPRSFDAHTVHTATLSLRETWTNMYTKSQVNKDGSPSKLVPSLEPAQRHFDSFILHNYSEELKLYKI